MHRLLISLGCSLVSTLLSESSKTVDVGLGSNSGGCRKLVCSTSDFLVGLLAFPDANSHSSHAVLHRHTKIRHRQNAFARDLQPRSRLTFPLNGLTYFALWVISNFLTTFLREAPYLHPYFPQIPTFFVLFAISI